MSSRKVPPTETGISSRLPVRMRIMAATATGRIPILVTSACPASAPAIDMTVITALASPNCSAENPSTCWA